MIHRIMKILTPVLQPAYRRYVSKTRNYRYKGITVIVKPGCFYPGFIFSTRIFLDFLDQIDLADKKFLELGAGSGIISILAARKRAVVTASDINPVAVECIRENSIINGQQVLAIQSDLFENIPEEDFDYIIITPPYYPKDPLEVNDTAWYCGSHFEYFRNLFPQLRRAYHPSCEILMILSEDCDIDRIRDIARQSGLDFTIVHQEKRMGEWNYIFRIGRETIVSDEGGN